MRRKRRKQNLPLINKKINKRHSQKKMSIQKRLKNLNTGKSQLKIQ